MTETATPEVIPCPEEISLELGSGGQIVFVSDVHLTGGGPVADFDATTELVELLTELGRHEGEKLLLFGGDIFDLLQAGGTPVEAVDRVLAAQDAQAVAAAAAGRRGGHRRPARLAALGRTADRVGRVGRRHPGRAGALMVTALLALAGTVICYGTATVLQNIAAQRAERHEGTDALLVVRLMRDPGLGVVAALAFVATVVGAWVLTRVDPGRATAEPKSDSGGPTGPRPESRENA